MLIVNGAMAMRRFVPSSQLDSLGRWFVCRISVCVGVNSIGSWYSGLALILSRLVRRLSSDRFIRVASSSSLVTTSLMPRSCAAPCTSLPFLLPTSTSLRIVPE